MVSASSGCHADEMMPKCFLTEVNLGVRLAHKGHLSPQYNSCLKAKMRRGGIK